MENVMDRYPVAVWLRIRRQFVGEINDSAEMLAKAAKLYILLHEDILSKRQFWVNAAKGLKHKLKKGSLD
jgi:hypothetical protein